MENFKCIKEFGPRYWISDLGRVFDCEKKQFLNQSLIGNYKKYYSVSINKKTYYVHRLLAKTFIENPLAKEYVDHIDGDRHNNKLDNLRWVTCSENHQNRRNAKGYTWNKKAGKWEAQIFINGEKKFLGYYDREKEAEARQAYLDAKKIYHPSSPIR